MPKQLARPWEKHMLRTFEGDWDELAAFHPKLTPTEVIRILIDNHLKACRENVNRNHDSSFTTSLAGTVELPADD